MRIRTLKPEYWPHRMHKSISEPAALLAIALLNLADDEGRFEADPAQIAAYFFPRRPLSKPVADCLEELVKADWIVLYQAKVGREDVDLGQVVNFSRHQRINRFTSSRLPAPPKTNSPTTHPPLTEDSLHEEIHDAVSTHTPLTLSCRREGKEGKGMKEGGEGDPPTDSPLAQGPKEEEIAAECLVLGIPRATGRRFWLHYAGKKPALTSNGEGFDWRLKLAAWADEDQADQAELGTKGGQETPADGELKDIAAELQWQTDKKRRAELLEKRRTLEGVTA